MRPVFLATLLAAIWQASTASAFETIPQPLILKTGDRVVLLGGTFIERAQRYGWLESSLQLRFPDASLTVRNLGWSADTVFAESRGIFDPPAKGYQRMITQVRDIKPTVILLNYGANEAFKGPGYLETFLTQYEKLIDDLGTTDAEIVLVGPLPLWRMPGPLPEPSAFNQQRAAYTDAINRLADRKTLRFLDMMQALEPLIQLDEADTMGVSEDGVTLTAEGYRLAAGLFVRAMFPQGSDLPENPASVDAIRKTVVEKNMMYFHHWRPQNVTYLFLFRKHEQGNNAKEVDEFKPIVAELEKRIFDLKSKAAR